MLGHLDRQLVAAPIAIQLVLLAIDSIGLAHDLPSDLPVVKVREPACVRLDLGAIQRDHPDPHQPRLRAQPQHITKQLRQRHLMPLAELGDRRMIRHTVSRDHPAGHILNTRPLDPPRRPVPPRIAIHQQRHHHPRVIRRAPVTIASIHAIQRVQIHLRDRIENRPHQVILRQPLLQRRRQQQHLIPITSNEVLRHAGMVLTPPDRLFPTATAKRSSARPFRLVGN